jgi:hypothetical protein
MSRRERYPILILLVLALLVPLGPARSPWNGGPRRDRGVSGSVPRARSFLLSHAPRDTRPRTASSS